MKSTFFELWLSASLLYACGALMGYRFGRRHRDIKKGHDIAVYWRLGRYALHHGKAPYSGRPMTDEETLEEIAEFVEREQQDRRGTDSRNPSERGDTP